MVYQATKFSILLHVSLYNVSKCRNKEVLVKLYNVLVNSTESIMYNFRLLIQVVSLG